MSKVIGIIACNYWTDFLQGKAVDKPFGALPFGGRYRLLDFALSSMVNSGLRTVGIITPYLYRPILDHLGAGKDWYLDRKAGGMFILPVSRHGIYPRYNKFALKDLVKNIEFLERNSADYVIISGCSNIFNLDYTSVLRNHEEKGADLTMIYKELNLEMEEDRHGVMLKVGENNKVVGLEGVHGQVSTKVKYFADVFIMRRKFLLDILKEQEYIEDMDLMDVLEENIQILRILAYPISGYFGRVYSIQSYFQRSMDMLNPSVRDELFMGTYRIHTKIKDNPPTKYGVRSSIRDSLVSSGCTIQGNVTRSILFRGVQVEAEARVSNCIIMQKCVIGKGAVLENVILDKYGQIKPKAVIKGENDFPVILNKCTVV